MNSKDLTIGVLSTTAVILLAGLFVVNSRPEPAYGFGMNAQGGDYLVTTGQLQESEELLYVVDARAKRMIVYRFDLNRGTITATDSAELSKLAGVGEDDSQKSGSNTRGQSRGRGRRR